MALALTMVALPALITANRRSSEQRPPTVAAVAPVGGNTANQLGPGAETTTTTSVVTTLSPDSTVAAAVASPQASTTVAAAPTYRHVLQGKATFQQYDDSVWGPLACAGAGIPIGTEVHIANLNSGLTASCTVRARLDANSGFVLVVDDSVFSALGDPVVGIVPVRITW